MCLQDCGVRGAVVSQTMVMDNSFVVPLTLPVPISSVTLTVQPRRDICVKCVCISVGFEDRIISVMVT